jgi:hypothetical protein
MATKTQEVLTLEGAKIAVAAAEKKAKEIGVDMNIAVVDASTHLLHFSRMEGAKITSISSMFLHFCFISVSFLFSLFLRILGIFVKPFLPASRMRMSISIQAIFH